MPDDIDRLVDIGLKIIKQHVIHEVRATVPTNMVGVVTPSEMPVLKSRVTCACGISMIISDVPPQEVIERHSLREAVVGMLAALEMKARLEEDSE